MRFRFWLLLFASAALSACNAALSDHPLFTEAQRSSTVSLEDGLWYRVAADCQVDVSKARDIWPKCANWVVLSGNHAVKSSDNKAEEEPSDVFIVDGKPPLIQAKVKTTGADAVYTFLGLDALATSPAGKLVDAKAWIVPCGVLAEKGGTKVLPYPGFTEECIVQSVDALRAAASKGPVEGSDVVEWKWVRAEAQ